MYMILYVPDPENPPFKGIWGVKREDFCLGYPVYSGVLVCPLCCQPWARLTAEGCPAHEPRMVSCTDCQWHHPGYEFLHPVPGSLIDNPTIGGVDWPLLDVLPEVLLRREFLLTLKAWDSHPW